MTCSPLNTDSHGFFNCFYDSAVLILHNFKLFWSGGVILTQGERGSRAQ